MLLGDHHYDHLKWHQIHRLVTQRLGFGVHATSCYPRSLDLAFRVYSGTLFWSKLSLVIQVASAHGLRGIAGSYVVILP